MDSRTFFGSRLLKTLPLLLSNLSALAIATMLSFISTLIGIDLCGARDYGTYIYTVAITGILIDILGSSLSSNLVRHYSSLDRYYKNLESFVASLKSLILVGLISTFLLVFSPLLNVEYSMGQLAILSRVLASCNRVFVSLIRTSAHSNVSDFFEYSLSPLWTVSILLISNYLVASAPTDLLFIASLFSSTLSVGCTLLFISQSPTLRTSLANLVASFFENNQLSVITLLVRIRSFVFANIFALISGSLPTLVSGLLHFNPAIISALNISRQIRTFSMYPLYAYSTLSDKYLSSSISYKKPSSWTANLSVSIYSMIPSAILSIFFCLFWHRLGSSMQIFRNLYQLLTYPEILMTLLICLGSALAWSLRRFLFYSLLDKQILLSEIIRISFLCAAFLLLPISYYSNTYAMLGLEAIASFILILALLPQLRLFYLNSLIK